MKRLVRPAPRQVAAVLVGLAAAMLLCGCTGLGRQARPEEIQAVQSLIPGVPVPEGSRLSEGGLFDGGEGVAMVFYTHPRLQGQEVLEFYDRVMPGWGWSVQPSEVLHRLQRAYVKDGVPIVIGVDKREKGASFNILKGVRGDWGYMAPMRGSS